MVESEFSSDSKSLVLTDTAGSKTSILLTSGPSNREAEIGGGVAGGASGAGAGAKYMSPATDQHGNPAGTRYTPVEENNDLDEFGRPQWSAPQKDDFGNEYRTLIPESDRDTLPAYHDGTNESELGEEGDMQQPIDVFETGEWVNSGGSAVPPGETGLWFNEPSGNLPRDMSSEQLEEKPEGFSETNLYYQSTPVYEDYFSSPTEQVTLPRDMSSEQLDSQGQILQQNEKAYKGFVQGEDAGGVDGAGDGDFKTGELDEDWEVIEFE